MLFLLFNLGYNRISAQEWKFFLTGAIAPCADALPNPAEDWLSEKTWNDFATLASQMKAFKGFDTDFASMAEQWKEVYEHSAPHTQQFPGTWNELSAFRKLIVLRCLTLDKVSYICILTFVIFL